MLLPCCLFKGLRGLGACGAERRSGLHTIRLQHEQISRGIEHSLARTVVQTAHKPSLVWRCFNMALPLAAIRLSGRRCVDRLDVDDVAAGCKYQKGGRRGHAQDILARK